MWDGETMPSALYLTKCYPSNLLLKKSLLSMFGYPNSNLYDSILFLLHLEPNREKPANNAALQGTNKAIL